MKIIQFAVTLSLLVVFGSLSIEGQLIRVASENPAKRTENPFGPMQANLANSLKRDDFTSPSHWKNSIREIDDFERPRPHSATAKIRTVSRSVSMAGDYYNAESQEVGSLFSPYGFNANSSYRSANRIQSQSHPLLINQPTDPGVRGVGNAFVFSSAYTPRFGHITSPESLPCSIECSDEWARLCRQGDCCNNFGFFGRPLLFRGCRTCNESGCNGGNCGSTHSSMWKQ